MSDRVYYSQEAKDKAIRNRTAIATLSLLVGAGIGAIMALLFAPEDGETIRSELSERTQTQFENGSEAGASALSSLETKYNDLRKYVEESMSKVGILN